LEFFKENFLVYHLATPGVPLVVCVPRFESRCATT